MDLSPLRRRVGLLVLGILWLFVPIIVGTAFLTGKPVALAGGGALLAALVATLVARREPGGPVARLVGAAASICSVSVLVWVAPDAMRIDMHMIYFAVVALLAGFCDPRPVVVATVVTAVHHLALDLLMPLAVFPDTDGGLVRVAIHAVILVMESSALILVAMGISNAAESAVGETRLQAERQRAAERAEAEAAQREAEERLARTGRHELADHMEATLSEVAAHVAGCAGEVNGAAEQLETIATRAAIDSGDAARASDTVARQVETVAAAVEELNASTGEITRQVEMATVIARKAVDQAERTDSTVAGLADSASHIGDVVRLISDIASRTNLLALNATIESARAGESGRGFAVVAGEVKSLAAQTAAATSDISQQISAIRETTQNVVEAVRAFGGTVAEVQQIANAIATAVDMQRAAIADSSSAAASIAVSCSEATQAVTRASVAMEQASAGVTALRHTSTELNGNGRLLRERVQAVVTQIKAA